MSTKIDEYNAGLTEEEIAALAAEDDAAGEHQPGEPGGDGADAKTEGGTDDKPAGGTEGGAAAEAEAQPEDGTEDKPAAVEPYRGVPLIKADAPANAEERLTAIAAERDALIEKFDSGELTTKEYTAQLEKLTDERDELRWSLRKNKLSEELTEQQKLDAWYSEVHSFATANPVLTSSPLIWNAFDEVVKRVGNDPATAGLADRDGLELAFKILKQELGALLGGVDPEPSGRADPSPSERNVPPSLARIPAAAVDPVSGSQFDALDKLSNTDPEKFEETFAKMSPADQQRYLAG